jgi:hypothetical protein
LEDDMISERRHNGAYSAVANEAHDYAERSNRPWSEEELEEIRALCAAARMPFPQKELTAHEVSRFKRALHIRIGRESLHK